jgi:integrase/recombinase XerD
MAGIPLWAPGVRSLSNLTAERLTKSKGFEECENGVVRLISLWLGHESVETTQVYMHADMRLKEKALERVTPPDSPPGRFRPGDALLEFLEAL